MAAAATASMDDLRTDPRIRSKVETLINREQWIFLIHSEVFQDQSLNAFISGVQNKFEPYIGKKLFNGTMLWYLF